MVPRLTKSTIVRLSRTEGLKTAILRFLRRLARTAAPLGIQPSL